MAMATTQNEVSQSLGEKRGKLIFILKANLIQLIQWKSERDTITK